MPSLTLTSSLRETRRTLVCQVRQTQNTHTHIMQRLHAQSFSITASLIGICMLAFPSGNGLGIRVVGGKEIPGSRGEIGAYIAKVIPGGVAEQTGKVVEGKRTMRKGGGVDYCLYAQLFLSLLQSGNTSFTTFIQNGKNGISKK